MPDVTRLGLALVLAGALGGCGGPALCVRSSDCGADRVCGLDGSCAPLAPPAGARFAGSRWLGARDWGVAGATTPLGDAMPVGGASAVEGLLRFGPIPPRGRILRALLVLHPHEGAHRVAAPAQIQVEQVEPFRGGALPARVAIGPDAFLAARRAIAEGPSRPVRLDVTEAARAAADREDRQLYVLVRASGGGAAPLAFASPFHVEPSARPRVELMLH